MPLLLFLRPCFIWVTETCSNILSETLSIFCDLSATQLTTRIAVFRAEDFVTQERIVANGESLTEHLWRSLPFHSRIVKVEANDASRAPDWVKRLFGVSGQKGNTFFLSVLLCQVHFGVTICRWSSLFVCFYLCSIVWQEFFQNTTMWKTCFDNLWTFVVRNEGEKGLDETLLRMCCGFQLLNTCSNQFRFDRFGHLFAWDSAADLLAYPSGNVVISRDKLRSQEVC